MNNLQEFIQKGIFFHKAGNIQEAELIYQSILKIKKDPIILHLLGVIKYQREEYSESIKLIEESLCLQPKYPAALSNLGNAYRKTGNYEKAIDCYNKSLIYNSNFIDALSNLGSLYIKINNYDLAEYNLIKALEINQNFIDALKNISSLYLMQNKFNAASEIYKKILKLDPFNVEAKYLYSALTGENLTSPPIEYIENLFDNYSNDFEDHLINKLHYETPRLLSEKLSNYLDKNLKFKILDLGCGSGLVGVELKEITLVIDGVDISSGMLNQAKKKGIYSNLFKRDIIHFLENNYHKYDLIVSSDVFNYFGDLNSVFKNIKNSLNDNGFFCFTVESALIEEKNIGFQLYPNGRYKHQREHILNLIENFNLRLIDCTDIVIRKEKGTPVQAYVFICTNC